MKLIKKTDNPYFDGEKSQEYYKNEFLRRRAEISHLTNNKGSIEIEDIYADAYIDQCEKAVGGDVIAQDLLSYWFKHSNPAVPENIEMSMKWLFIAGSNGNKHSISKLSLFFNYAYDSVIFTEYYSDLAQLMGINLNNYQYILGEVMCKYMCEELGINALDLAKERTVEIPFNQTSMQRLTASLNRAMSKVDEYFRNFVKKNKVG